MWFTNWIYGNFLAGLSYYRYLLTFAVAIVEGPMVMVGSGILLRLEFFYFWPIYLSLMLGDFVADLGWYWVGRLRRPAFCGPVWQIF